MTTDRAPFRLNFWMTVCAVPALTVLVGLGVWQLQRLEWKEGIIADRTARLAQPAVPLADVPADGWQTYEMRRVTAEGRFLHDRSLELASKSFGGRPGVHIVTPLRLADDSGTVLIDRGWAPPRGDRRPGEIGAPPGPVRLTGILRGGGRTSGWVPDNEPAKGIWFFVDPPAMAAALGLPEARPYILEIEKPDRDNVYPVGGRTVTEIRNNHLQYAITWFGLALALIAVYVVYHLKRRT